MAPFSLEAVMGVRLLAVTVVFTVLATLAVWGRFWARFIRKTAPAANDYVILVALFLTWGLAIFNIIGSVNAGFGKHADSVTKEELLLTAKLFVAFPVLWGSAVTASKIGILLLYLTIFRNNRLFKIAAYSLIAIAFCYGLSVIVAGLTVCQPIAKYWDQTIDGTCGNVILFYVITSGFNLGIDLIILFLPLPMLWRLQMKASKKIGLTLLFGTGFVACIATALRIIAVKHLDTADIVYTTASDALYAILEPALGIIVACVPVMQPVLSRLREYLSSFTGSRGTSQRFPISFSKKPRDEKPLKRHADDQLYPLSDYAGTIDGTEAEVSRCEVDIESGRDANHVTNPDGINVKTDVELSYEASSRI